MQSYGAQKLAYYSSVTGASAVARRSSAGSDRIIVHVGLSKSPIVLKAAVHVKNASVCKSAAYGAFVIW